MGHPALMDALKTRLFDLRKGGFNRLYQGGEVYEFSTPESLLDINFARASVCAGGSARGFGGGAVAHCGCD